MNAHDNEHVTLQALHGFVTDDVFGAFAEMEAIAAASQCQKYLFSLSLNPPHCARVDVALFERVTKRAAQSLGLMGEPYELLFHKKTGSAMPIVSGQDLTAPDCGPSICHITYASLWRCLVNFILSRGGTCPPDLRTCRTAIR